MTTDAITDAVTSAIDSIGSSLPSQSASVGVDGVRATRTGTRRIRGVLTAVVVDSGFDEPYGDTSIRSEVRTKTLVFTRCGSGGWFDRTPPRDGDVFTFQGGEKFAVFSVEEKANGAYYKIGVRQC